MECIPRAITLLVAARFWSQQSPQTVSEISPGLFVQTGAMELVTRGNEEAIANVGFVIRADAVAVIDPGGSVREI